MTTPDTSAVRAWARENGYEVADRGRLPADVTGAYLAANGKGGKPAAKKAAPARKPAPAKTLAPAKAVRAAKPAAAPVEGSPAEAPPGPSGPQAKPSVVTDDRRLVALGEEIAALTKRVEALEKASGGSKSGGRTPRFRRRS